MSTAATTVSLFDRLKSETRAQHARAETQPLQKSLIQGTVTREHYGKWLVQMLHIHAAMERHLRRFRPTLPQLAPIQDDQFHEAALRADLAALGIDPRTVPAAKSTQALVATIDKAAAADPIAILGFFYVLEGSTNGNGYIAMALRPALKIGAGGDAKGGGDTYLDPYAGQARQHWQAFRAAMEPIAFTAAQSDAILEAAKAMFDGITAMSGEVA